MKIGSFRSYHICRTGAPKRDRRMVPPSRKWPQPFPQKEGAVIRLSKKRPHGVTTRAKDGQKVMGLYDSQVQNTSQRMIAKGASTLPPA